MAALYRDTINKKLPRALHKAKKYIFNACPNTEPNNLEACVGQFITKFDISSLVIRTKQMELIQYPPKSGNENDGYKVL